MKSQRDTRSDQKHGTAAAGNESGGLLLTAAAAVCLLVGLATLSSALQPRSFDVLETFDTLNLRHFLSTLPEAETLTIEWFPVGADGNPGLINTELLGLRQDRLAYLARSVDEVVAIIVPATAEDGFNGFVDLLVAVDVNGHVLAARVIRDLETSQLHGTVDVIESRWMQEFDGSAMRDIRSFSWQTIEPDNEYDQFVGASVTPKTVSDRLYDTLVFIQSNRIALISGSFTRGGG